MYTLVKTQENNLPLGEYTTLQEALDASKNYEDIVVDIKLPNGDYYDWTKNG